MVFLLQKKHQFFSHCQILRFFPVFPLVWRNHSAILYPSPEGGLTMRTESMKKLDRLLYIIRLFQVPGRRYRVREVADRLGINEDTAGKYLQELSGSGILPVRREGLDWILPEGST